MKRRFVSSTAVFECLKRKFLFFLCFIFPLLLRHVALVFFGFSLFPVSSFVFLLFPIWVSLITLDHSLRNFFVGVCRVAESEGRPVDFGDLVPLDCVLRRLSEELFSLVFPTLST